MKNLIAILFVATGVGDGLVGAYLCGAYVSGFPASWWSAPFVAVLLGASIAIATAGLIVRFSARISRILVLCGGGLMEVLLGTGLILGLKSILLGQSNLAWVPFLVLIVIPLVLTTSSLLLVSKVR